MSAGLVEAAATRSTTGVGPRHTATSCCPPFIRSLCGLPLEGEPTEGEPTDGAPTCVVCAEMERGRLRCPNCGSPVGLGWP